MQKRFRYKHFRMALAAVICLLCLTPAVQQLAKTPEEIDIPLGQRTVLPMRLPAQSQVKTSNFGVARVEPVLTQGSRARDVAVISRDVGDTIVTTRLFGIVPWKTVQVHVVPEEHVFVGGQSVGIRLLTNGVIVVGFQRIGANHRSPAAASQLRIGDVIEKVNGCTVHSASDLRRFVSSTPDGHLQLQVRRGSEYHVLDVQPGVDDAGSRRLGLFVREKTSGVGTLTFYDPARHRFGALGHVITDADTGQAIRGTGSMYEAEVTGMVRGAVGKPGEKRGRFISPAKAIGHIGENSPYGVFGDMNKPPRYLYNGHVVPVALPTEVHQGAAKMLTVIHGQSVEAFDVEIESLVRQDKPGTKSMIVHVADPRLIAQTGGIVQGMSGSPLLQNGKLVGAITHVFVSDPTRGYGVYAEWMLRESCNGALAAWNRDTKAAAVPHP